MTVHPTSVRRMTVNDGDDLLAIWNESADLDPMSRQLLDEKIWQDADFDPALTFVAQRASRTPIGFVAGVVRDSDSVRRGFIKLIAVRPNQQRRGVGSLLLSAVEHELVRQGCECIRIGESAPNYLMPGLDVRYTSALLLFERNGYRRFSETYNMTVDLDATNFEPTILEPTAFETTIFETTDADRGPAQSGIADRGLGQSSIAVRRATLADKPRMMGFLADHWPAWRSEISNCFSNMPLSLHLAFRGEALVAFSGYDGNNVGTGWFGPMGTAESARGAGIGGVLLKRCLADIKAQGKHEAIIPWVGPIGFYAHHVGARISRVFLRLEKQTG